MDEEGEEKLFRYKLHQNSDINYCLIREIEVTTAKVHDSRVDLPTKGEIVIRDRGYFGVSAKGEDFTMAEGLPMRLWVNLTRRETG